MLFVLFSMLFLAGCDDDKDKECDKCKDQWQKYRDCLEEKVASQCSQPGCDEGCG
jgi:hypothetical protein